MKTVFFDIGFTGSVDEANGVVRGVSVCTAGVKARGHDMETDETTLLQMKRAAEASGGKVPVKWNHQTGADAVNGFVTNFRVDGNKLVADWHLLKSHEKYHQAMELASRMPQNIGLSAAFKGEPERKGSKKLARCTELLAVDLVAHPAANPDGLFERGTVDSRRGKVMDENPNKIGVGGIGLEDIKAVLDDMNERQEAMMERLEQQEAFLADLENELAGDGGEEEGEGEEGEEGGEDAGEAGGEGEPSGEGGAELSVGKLRTAQDVVRYFEQRERKARNVHEERQIVTAFSVLQEKVGRVTEFANELAAENEALREHIQLLEAGGGRTTGGPGRDSRVRYFSRSRETATTEFEAQVAELAAEGMKRTDAILKVKREAPHLFEEHLAAKGVVKHL